MSVLVCEGITKIEKNKPSIRNFNFNFLDNRIYGIVGKSDSGNELLLQFKFLKMKKKQLLMN